MLGVPSGTIRQRQHDEAVGAVTRFLNWAVKSGKLLQHHCHKLPKIL